jgi:hypothetical protein
MKMVLEFRGSKDFTEAAEDTSPLYCVHDSSPCLYVGSFILSEDMRQDSAAATPLMF